MRHAMIEREQTAGSETECAPCGPYPNVAGQHLDCDPALGFVFGNARSRLEGSQDDTQVIVFDECSGVLTGAPRRLSLQTVDLCR